MQGKRRGPHDRLVTFRLTDVPEHIRIAAARQLVAGDSPLNYEHEHPEDKLLAALVRPKHDDILVAAAFPSNKAYRISETAWRAIMG